MLTDKPQPYKLKIPDDINQKSPLRWLLIILLIVRIIYSIKLCYDEFQAFEKVNKGIFAGLNDINVGYQKEKHYLLLLSTILISYYLFTNISGLISIFNHYWIMYLIFIIFNIICISIDIIMAQHLQQKRFYIMMATSIVVLLLSLIFLKQIYPDWSYGIELWPNLPSTKAAYLRFIMIVLNIVRSIVIVFLMNNAYNSFDKQSTGILKNLDADLQTDKIMIFLFNTLNIALYTFVNIYGIMAIVYNRLPMLITCIVFNIICLVLDWVIHMKVKKFNRIMWIAILLSFISILFYILFILMTNDLKINLNNTNTNSNSNSSNNNNNIKSNNGSNDNNNNNNKSQV